MIMNFADITLFSYTFLKEVINSVCIDYIAIEMIINYISRSSLSYNKVQTVGRYLKCHFYIS